MFIYSDQLFIDENGDLYTAEYVENNDYIKKSHTLRDAGGAWDHRGEKVRCNYSQYFHNYDGLILCNNIVEVFPELYDYIENGDLYDESGDYVEVFQYYIIPELTADLLKDHTDCIIFYCEQLDIYILGVDHFGTSWSYVGAEFTL